MTLLILYICRKMGSSRKCFFRTPLGKNQAAIGTGDNFQKGNMCQFVATIIR